MKWATTKLNPKIPKGERGSFEVLVLEEIKKSTTLKPVKKGQLSNYLRSQLGNAGFKEWVTYPEPGDPKLPANFKSSAAVKRKYEIFIGGFLCFYDDYLWDYIEKIKKEYPLKFNKEPFGDAYIEKLKKFFTKIKVGQEHTVFFEWGTNPDNKNLYSVRIYINPPAGNPDPPRPPKPPPPESNP